MKGSDASPVATGDQYQDMLFVDALEVSNWDREVLEELRAGQLSCVNVTCALWEDAAETLYNLGLWNERFQEHADIIVKVRSVAEIRAAKAAGLTGIMLGFQNASPIEDKFRFIEIFHDLGVRIVQLTYNNLNLLGAGCYEETDPGLSRFGRLAVREMNRLGMVVDLSHVGERTSLEAIGMSSRPVAITHANPKFFFSHPRNKSDEVLKALASTGGVLGLTPIPLLVAGGSNLKLDDWLAMLERTIELMGIQHVGIGTDSVRKCTPEDIKRMRNGRWTPTFDPDPGAKSHGISALEWPPWPSWFQSPADFPNLASVLLQRGFRRDEVAAILGGNWLRLFDEVFSKA